MSQLRNWLGSNTVQRSPQLPFLASCVLRSVDHELVHQRHLREDGQRDGRPGAVQQEGTQPLLSYQPLEIRCRVLSRARCCREEDSIGDPSHGYLI